MTKRSAPVLGCRYVGTITGQGNGQGGREHGQKADHLPGQRSIMNPEHRSKGGNADYYGISYEKIDSQNGVFWPCPSEDYPGTPRMFEGYKFYHPDGKTKFHAVEYVGAHEKPDEEYPLILTSGRLVYQYLSGNQTRRIGFLVQQCPEPYVEIHPETAAKMQIIDGERVKVVSRRGEGVFPALIVRTVRPDTIFIPYPSGEQLAVNQLTNPKLDPISKIPEYKACAARIEKIHSRELSIIASGVCWLIALTIFLWWKPASRHHTGTGYIRNK